MNCQSNFKTFILSQLSDKRSFQSCYSQFLFPLRVCPRHSDLNLSPSHLDSPRREKCG